jgi:hypothetical protein
LSSKEDKEKIVKEFGQPIEYIFYCLENNILINSFNIQNAKEEWKSINKEQKVIAYVKQNYNEEYYDLTFDYDPYEDQSKVIKLYRE